MLKPEIEVQSIENIPWTHMDGYSDGCYDRVLSRDAHNPGNVTRLVRIEPGVEIARPMSHDFWEETYILEGYLLDRGVYCGKDYYSCRPPGMVHGPIRSPVGCFVLQYRYFAARLRKPEIEFRSIDQLPWTPLEGFPEGFYEKILTEDASNPRNYWRLVRVEPGMRQPRTLEHDFWEEIYLVDGYLIDRHYFQKKGDYGCRPPGMLHNPLRTPAGFVTSEFRYDADAFDQCSGSRD